VRKLYCWESLCQGFRSQVSRTTEDHKSPHLQDPQRALVASFAVLYKNSAWEADRIEVDGSGKNPPRGGRQPLTVCVIVGRILRFLQE
jgi:hypothetical protein